MQLYLDTADRAAAESLLVTGLFAGVTTNPTILQRASKGVADVGDDGVLRMRRPRPPRGVSGEQAQCLFGQSVLEHACGKQPPFIVMVQQSGVGCLYV